MRRINEKLEKLEGQYEKLRGETDETHVRIAEMTVEKEDLRIFTQSLRFRIVTAERYAASLWEALVWIGGFRRREDAGIPSEEREEILIREEENQLNWEAGRTRKARTNRKEQPEQV